MLALGEMAFVARNLFVGYIARPILSYLQTLVETADGDMAAHRAG